MNKADIGLIGLAVMGKNLVLNMEDKGFCVAVFNRNKEVIKDFINVEAKNKNIMGKFTVEEFVNSLKTPRKIMLMVKSGEPVDYFIKLLIQYLDKGDIIIDGGNSHFLDTIRRSKYVESHGLFYIGMGVSGGEEGALKGPSIMPGGSIAGWDKVKPIFQKISAKVKKGLPCCQWIGSDGAGHFVKMVHNGIEYGDMQIICEAYMLMRDLLNMDEDEMSETFKDWNLGVLNSYLIEITAEILAFKDNDGLPLVEKILDKANQKGTGKWMSVVSLEQGEVLTLITQAVYARYLSAKKTERINASEILKGPGLKFSGDKKLFLEDIKNALYASKIISYAQGYALMKTSSKIYKWNLDYGHIALLWREGCIIRSAFLNKIKEAFDKTPDLDNLLLDSYFNKEIDKVQDGWRRVVSTAVLYGVSIPAFSSALSYYDGYRCEKSAANLLQAQRDYFGAHTYERIDKNPGEFYHTNWLA